MIKLMFKTRMPGLIIYSKRITAKYIHFIPFDWSALFCKQRMGLEKQWTVRKLLDEYRIRNRGSRVLKGQYHSASRRCLPSRLVTPKVGALNQHSHEKCCLESGGSGSTFHNLYDLGATFLTPLPLVSSPVKWRY